MRDRNSKRQRVVISTAITQGQFNFCMVCLVLMVVFLFIGVPIKNKPQSVEDELVTTEPTVEVFIEEPTKNEESSVDRDERWDLLNLAGIDLEDKLYDSGFRYYNIPEKYIENGGRFSEIVQAYLWCQCKQRGIDYYIVVALIELESNYNCEATGDNGNSKGYMQIWESWHKDRMQAEDVEDLYNPFGNIRVGLNFLQELIARAGGDSHYVLMSYNMGENKCKEFISEGIYSTEYSRWVLQRAQEIKQELQD